MTLESSIAIKYFFKVANEFKCEIPDFFAENDKLSHTVVVERPLCDPQKFLNLRKILNPQEFFPSKII